MDVSNTFFLYLSLCILINPRAFLLNNYSPTVTVRFAKQIHRLYDHVESGELERITTS